MSETSVSVSHLAYTLGDDVREVATLSELEQRTDVRDTLLEFGLRNYRTSSLAPLELALDCTKRTLGTAEIDPRTIDILLLATSSFADPSYYSSARVAGFMSALELHNAYPIGTTLSYCGNVHSALRLGALLIRAGEAQRILVVCADRVHETETRIVPPAISISSDGAASCLLQRESRSGYALLGTAQVCNPDLAPEDAQGRFMLYMQGVGKGVKQAFQTLVERTGISAAQISCVIPNNYNLWVLGNIGRVLGIERGRVFSENIPRFAHANTADDLINLVDREAAEALPPGSHILLLGTGPNMWGLSLFKKLGAESSDVRAR